MPAVERLYLVFNADSGAWSAFMDSVKKALGTGSCTLCEITHGLAGEKPEWRDCKADFGVPVEYVHRDELRGELGKLAEGRLPCVVAEAGGELRMLLPPDDLATYGGRVEGLAEGLRLRAAEAGLTFPV